jgi:hypothetical protein
MPRKTNRLRDWLFGSPTKRLLLHAVVRQPARRWTKSALAREADAHAKGGLDEHLLALVQLGVLVRADASYELSPESDLVGPLSSLLDALEAIPDDDLARP